MTMPREAKLAAELTSPTLRFVFLQTGRQGHPADDAKALDHQAVSAQANDRLDPVWACILGMRGHKHDTRAVGISVYERSLR